ncbi:glycosyltransferase family 2 protein [Azospirillum sp. Marseille-Q6669]
MNNFDQPLDAELGWVRDVLSSHRHAKILADEILVSIIYPFFERPDYILRSIESVREQRGTLFKPEQIEIIVIDDGSSNDRNAIADRLPPDIVYLWQRKARFGASRARNSGAKIANGRYLFFLDPDIVVGPGYVEAGLAAFGKHGDRLLQTGYIWDYFFAGADDPREEFGVWDCPDAPSDRFLHLAAGSAAIARALFLESGGFDEDLIYGGWEDIEFGHRVGTRPGTAMVYNTGMECRHIPHPPSPRLSATDLSKEICRIKHPDFYELYFVKGMR